MEREKVVFGPIRQEMEFRDMVESRTFFPKKTGGLFQMVPGQKIMDIFKCCFCFKPMYGSRMSTCLAGHMTCGNCQTFVAKCVYMTSNEGMCMKPIYETKCQFYNYIWGCSVYSCPFASRGCKYLIFGFDLTAHENACTYKPHSQCLYLNCKRFNNEELPIHLLKHHHVWRTNEPNQFVPYNPLAKDVSQFYSYRFAQAIMYLDNFDFVWVVMKHRGYFWIWPQLLNDSNTHEEFYGEVVLFHKNRKVQDDPVTIPVSGYGEDWRDIVRNEKCIQFVGNKIFEKYISCNISRPYLEMNLYIKRHSEKKPTSVGSELIKRQHGEIIN